VRGVQGLMAHAGDGAARLRPVPSAVVMQPTTTCNLACDYCYLPARPNQHMAPAVAHRVAAAVNRWVGDGHLVRVFWHCGEPLVAGRDRLADLMAPFAASVVHGVQTNATLIDDRWCEFFLDRGIEVSISIDGPEELDVHRVQRGGRPAHSRIMAGIAALRRNDVPFGALAVVTDPTPDAARRLYDFFADLGARRLGVSLQQSLSPTRCPRDGADYEEFWLALLEAWLDNPVVRIREIDHCIDDAFRLLNDPERNGAADVDPLPAVGWDGEVVLTAPELLGLRGPDDLPFSSGNVLETPLDAIIATAAERSPWLAAHLAAAQECLDTCPYGAICPGPSPAPSWFETGTLTTGPTEHCRGAVIAAAEAITLPLLRRAARPA